MTIKFRPRPFDPEELETLLPAFPDHVPIDFDATCAAFQQGRVRLLDIERDGDPVMLAAVATGCDFFGSYGCVAAAVGDAPGLSLTDETLPLFEGMFRAYGLQWSKITTARPGLKRKLAAHGYRSAGEIFLKPLGH